MTWTKLGNEFLPESKGLSHDAFRLHVEALLWSSWRLLDLVIPRMDLPMLATPGAAPIPDVIDELISSGWWQMIDDDHYWIGCRFSEWQQDKAQVEHRRAQLALAQRRKRLHDIGDHKLCLRGRCKELSTVDSTVESTVESCDDPDRLRNGTVTGKPQTKPRQQEGKEPEVAARLQVNGQDPAPLVCESCGAAGETSVDSHGWRICVGPCAEIS